MSCDATLLSQVPLFSLLDADERNVLASHVEVRTFDAHQRIYHHGDAAGRAYVLIAGRVRVTLVDQDQQEVTMDEPAVGGVFGFASLLEGTPHQTSAVAVEPVSCLEIGREALRNLIHKRPDAGMDMLAVLGNHLHAAQRLVSSRSLRNPNEVIEQETTAGERIADAVARFGGSWRFINLFAAVLVIYTIVNIALGRAAWDPYPFILLNLFLSMLAAVQAPVIMMSQNRQDAKDRVRSEMDFEVNRRAEIEIRAMSGKLNTIDDRLDDIERLVRQRDPSRP